MEDKLIRIEPEIVDPAPGNSLQGHGAQAMEALVSKLPDVIDTISRIAEQTATTQNQIKLIEAEGRYIMADALAHVERARQDRDMIRERGSLILQTLREVNQALADARIPEQARILYAQNLPLWVSQLVQAVTNEGERRG